jgi:hypothetical protein
MRTLLFFVAGCGVAAQAALSAPYGDPRAFLKRVAAYEARSDTSIRSPTFLALLAPRLRKAVRADLSHSDIGVLDYDPICQCQDTVALQIVLVATKGSSAVATLATRTETDRVLVHLHLIRSGGDWLIADISTKDQRSLLSDLERESIKGR